MKTESIAVFTTARPVALPQSLGSKPHNYA